MGQHTNVKTRDATAVAAPSTLAVDPGRMRLPVNEEQPIHELYGYIYIADRVEGLVISTAATLLDGNPSNNFLKRAGAFNPGGALNGAVNLAIAGNYAYMLADRGLVIVDMSKPLQPTVVARDCGARDSAAPLHLGPVPLCLHHRRGRREGGRHHRSRTARGSPGRVAVNDARGIYVARTYAYVAAGSQGIVIVDVERPESPKVDQTFNADGELNDARDVKIAMTNASVFGYVADGKNGLRVLEMVSAN